MNLDEYKTLRAEALTTAAIGGLLLLATLVTAVGCAVSYASSEALLVPYEARRDACAEKADADAVGRPQGAAEEAASNLIGLGNKRPIH